MHLATDLTNNISNISLTATDDFLYNCRVDTSERSYTPPDIAYRPRGEVNRRQALIRGWLLFIPCAIVGLVLIVLTFWFVFVKDGNKFINIISAFGCMAVAFCIVMFGNRGLEKASWICNKCGAGKWEEIEKEFIKQFEVKKLIREGRMIYTSASSSGWVGNERVDISIDVPAGREPDTFRIDTYDKYLHTYKCDKCGATTSAEKDYLVKSREEQS